MYIKLFYNSFCLLCHKVTSLQHLDLDFEKYLNCDSNAQTNDKMTDEAIADFCLNKNNRRSRRRNG
jgi:hypothetical protein